MHTNCSLGVFMAVLLCVLTCVPLCLFCAEFFLRFLGRLVFICKFSYSFLRFIHDKRQKHESKRPLPCILYKIYGGGNSPAYILYFSSNNHSKSEAL